MDDPNSLNVTDEVRELIKKGLVVCHVQHKTHPFGIFYGENPLDCGFPLMLFNVALILSLSSLLRILLKPLRQPQVISNIIGGIIIGPSVLCRSERFRSYIFPETAMVVVRNLGVIGFCYFLFITGVKMDVTVIKRVGKKHWYIACVGIIVPLCFSVSLALLLRKSFDKEMSKLSSIWGVTTSLAITSFSVLYPIIKELNLLSSEMGRMALSTAIVTDVVGISGIIIFEAAKQGEMKTMAALYFTLSLLFFAGAMIFGARPAFMWIIRSTPEGKPVDQIYVIGILLGVLVAGFLTDFLGLAIGNGPLWLGLAVPDGPPLGAILVEKSETIVHNFLMPCAFILVGTLVDVWSISIYWVHLKPLLFIVLATYVIKLLATLVAARMFKMSIRDSLVLSLIMSLRGETEFLLFLHWIDFRMVGPPHIAILVLITISMTAISTPLISTMYDPTRPYMVNKRRNIQHKPPNSKCRVVICIPSEESVYGLVNLLRIYNPSAIGSFSIHALRLIELVGRASPVFIDHKNKDQVTKHSQSSTVQKVLQIFQENIGEHVKLHWYTTVTTKRTMYQDICELALNTKACMIILPHHMKSLNHINASEDVVKQGFQSIIANVLENAPCSVGILVDKSPCFNSSSVRTPRRHFAVLFLGGADAREALTYADLMASNADMSLTVIRFLAHESEGEYIMEKKVDDGLVMWFWVKNEGNERIVYREVVVRDGGETVDAIRAMDENFDLWIVGIKQGINPVLLEGLTNWSENSELGVIGEFIASDDFNCTVSVLAIQQQILRGQESTKCNMFSRLSFSDENSSSSSSCLLVDAL